MYHTDDLLHRVDRIYLGPPGKTAPFKIRYTAYGVGALVFVTTTVFLRGMLSIPWTSSSTLILFAVTIFITGRLMQFITGDVTVRSVLTAAYHDLVAPRPPKTGAPVSVAPLPEHRMRHNTPAAGTSAPTDLPNDSWSDAA